MLEWQKVSFLILMILVAVAAIDWISSKLRFAIIGAARSLDLRHTEPPTSCFLSPQEESEDECTLEP